MTRYLSAKYVDQFRCDGAACGARCCRGWSIEFTTQDKTRLERAIPSTAIELRRKLQAIQPFRNVASREMHTHQMQFNKEGHCRYLLPEQLCELHSTFGDRVLADICSQYPREVGKFGDQKEIWATLACPVAARLCLFDEAGADLVELNNVQGLRTINSQMDVNEHTPDYQAYLDEVRQFVIKLLSIKEYSLRERLFFVAYFGHRTKEYFHSGATQVDRRRLNADMRALLDPALLRGLAGELDLNHVPGNYAISLILSILPHDTEHGSRSSAVAIPTELASVAALGLKEATEITSDDWLQVWMEYSVKRLRWEQEFNPIVEQAVENYCKVFWLKDWYVVSPNLLVHAVACVLRVAIMRFRLFCCPALNRIEDGIAVAARRSILEEGILEVVTEVSRVIDHDRAFRTTLHEALAKRGMEDLAHAGILLML